MRSEKEKKRRSASARRTRRDRENKEEAAKLAALSKSKRTFKYTPSGEPREKFVREFGIRGAPPPLPLSTVVDIALQARFASPLAVMPQVIRDMGGLKNAL